MVILSTKIARRNHFEARYGENKVQFIHNLAFSRLSKSGFTITSLVYCDKTIQRIVLKFVVVLDIGLEIVNPFLYCKNLLHSEDYAFLRQKNAKKVKITSVFAEFSRTPQ